MKKIFLVITLFVFSKQIFGQEPKVQEWKTIVSQNKKDTTTLIALDSLQARYGNSLTDSGMYYLQQIKNLSEQIGNKKYLSFALRSIASKYFTIGKTVEALKLQYRALALTEETKDSVLITRIYTFIGNSYKEYGDYEKALSFYKKALSIAMQCNKDVAILVSTLNLGYTYAQLNQLDSALYFEQQAYIIGIKLNLQLPGIESYLGDIQFKLGNIAIAKEFYTSSFARISKTKEIIFGSRAVVWPCLGLANCYNSLHNADSAIVFSKRALAVSEKINYLKGIRDAQKLLSELFDEKHAIDSAFYYQKQYIASSDSLYNRDKSSAIESLTFEQELQAKEKQAEIEKQKEERSHNLQLAMIAIGILSIIIIFLLVSNSFIVSHKVVGFLSVLVLLVLFEFINLLIHPFLEKFTHHSPFLMLLGLVTIAALIIPLHHKLEHWATHKLVEKNKAIRLANAKRTIEELESTS
jgi:tetratricopeptide (TPR) repeat protein